MVANRAMTTQWIVSAALSQDDAGRLERQDHHQHGGEEVDRSQGHEGVGAGDAVKALHADDAEGIAMARDSKAERHKCGGQYGNEGK
jgi:hypothetical protein